MKKVDCIIYIMKILYLSLITCFICLKLNNSKYDKRVKYFITFLSCGAFSIICLVLRIFTGKSLYSNLFLYFSLCIYLRIIIKKDIGNIMLSVIISIAIYYVFYAIAVVLSFFIENFSTFKNKFLSFVIIILFTQIFIRIFFNVKRFKNGFQFLNNKKSKSHLNIALICLSSIILYLYSIVTYNFEISPNDDVEFVGENGTRFLYFSILYFAIIIIIIIKDTLTLYYKQKLLENTLSDYEKQIKEKDEKIKKLSDEKFQISKLNHEFHNRQEALMLKVENVLNNMNYESGEEIDLRDKVNSLSNEYNEKLKKNKTESNLTKTGIDEIDDMFTYMQSECNKNGIEFILQINGNINYLINNYIEKSKLVTLIGDHLRDAIIAVNYSSNKYKSILAILGIKDENYEFCIFDSGIEFEIETFDKLGLEPATTHKDDGGTGIGFVTTFETLKETKASFEIEELNELKENSYTKCIRFIFDKKFNMRIISYRSDILKTKIKSNRFKII